MCKSFQLSLMGLQLREEMFESDEWQWVDLVTDGEKMAEVNFFRAFIQVKLQS